MSDLLALERQPNQAEIRYLSSPPKVRSKTPADLVQHSVRRVAMPWDLAVDFSTWRPDLFHLRP
ncbi:MAG: hypothetical protein JNL67_07620 [Planctomycetaceae bacterium]|nr:hypothetical protein [Planctomycetaceae bacterium]